MSSERLIPLFAGVALAAAAGGRLTAQELTDASYERWRNQVLPTPKELAYQGVAWRPSFWEAVVEAQERDKPVLLWAMNGHPLCNT